MTVIFSLVKDHLLGVAGKTRRYVYTNKKPMALRKVGTFGLDYGYQTEYDCGFLFHVACSNESLTCVADVIYLRG